MSTVIAALIKISMKKITKPIIARRATLILQKLRLPAFAEEAQYRSIEASTIKNGDRSIHTAST
jgi:hypothetical protein